MLTEVSHDVSRPESGFKLLARIHFLALDATCPVHLQWGCRQFDGLCLVQHVANSMLGIISDPPLSVAAVNNGPRTLLVREGGQKQKKGRCPPHVWILTFVTAAGITWNKMEITVVYKYTRYCNMPQWIWWNDGAWVSDLVVSRDKWKLPKGVLSYFTLVIQSVNMCTVLLCRSLRTILNFKNVYHWKNLGSPLQPLVPFN